MLKKIAALVGAGAILLSVAVPAFGFFSKDIAIIKGNDVTAVANTGGNSQGNVADVGFAFGVTVSGGNGTQLINTGDAHAKAGAITVANTHVGCGPCAGGGFFDTDVAVIKRNDVGAEANTGVNSQGNYAGAGFAGFVNVSGGSGDQTVRTGDAWVKAGAITVVNTHWGL